MSIILNLHSMNLKSYKENKDMKMQMHEMEMIHMALWTVKPSVEWNVARKCGNILFTCLLWPILIAENDNLHFQHNRGWERLNVVSKDGWWIIPQPQQNVL